MKQRIQNSLSATIGFNTFRQITTVNHPNAHKLIYAAEQIDMQVRIIDVVKELSSQYI